jgi:hypothetical protein
LIGALRGIGLCTFLLRGQNMKKHYSQPHFMIGAAIDIKPITEPSFFFSLCGIVTNDYLYAMITMTIN